jgi:hypothetical protein
VFERHFSCFSFGKSGKTICSVTEFNLINDCVIPAEAGVVPAVGEIQSDDFSSKSSSACPSGAWADVLLFRQKDQNQRSVTPSERTIVISCVRPDTLRFSPATGRSTTRRSDLRPPGLICHGSNTCSLLATVCCSTLLRANLLVPVAACDARRLHKSRKSKSGAQDFIQLQQ